MLAFGTEIDRNGGVQIGNFRLVTRFHNGDVDPWWPSIND
ncbi:Uncharacterised protein [Vibrio cholerae]|nr:Uncharacterised protein [Vibrio cholerae]CSI85404.1 Uncharacterised protein [Vibrio cholerae]